ncbi:DNA mismatch repair endonuclease MutL [Anaeromassilibacillus sp. SJQ-5]
MPHIQVLDKHTAELIAAGEVVERPSSVVKELLENTIDAGATMVAVEIQNGGVTYIRITDNGAGIAREDVPTAFLRHATSKVRREEDLEAIGTLGFRGEALASIAAVSRVELLTCAAGETAGTRYTLEGGEDGHLEDTGCPQGTTIVVRDLFYNVPARMKFLKKDVSEANAVAGVVDRIALSHPEVSFRFIRDGREELLTPGDSQLRSCIYAVLGKEFSDSLLPVDYTLGGVHVHGFASKPAASRANRTMQHFFINGRYVKTRTAMAALEQAYKGAIMVGKFPACVLHLDMPPETVDANVHPAKIEVRFINEKPVFDAVYHGLKSALAAGDVPKQAVLPVRPAVGQPQAEQLHMEPPAAPRSPASHIDAILDKPPAQPTAPAPAVPSAPPAARPRPVLRDGTDAPYYAAPSYLNIERTSVQPAAAPEPPPAPPPVREEPAAPPPAEKASEPVVYVGEVFHTYVIAQMGESLYVIDKHAAHERLLYNQLKATPHNDAQMLLEPVSVPLGREEYAAVTAELETLGAAGFEVEDFGGSTVLVRAVPLILSGCDAAAAIQEIAGGFVSGKRELTMDKLDWIYHSSACRAAVKAGDSSRPEELRQLAERVLQNDDIRYCPHGRPVCFELTRRELEKQFGRV